MARRVTWLLAAGGIAAIVGIIGAATYRTLAIRAAPARTAVRSRTHAALDADSTFWQTLHAGHYDRIQPAIEALARAYDVTPNDPTTAAHLGWLHIWRIAESSRLDTVPASITEEMALARRYFAQSVALDPG